MGTTSSRCSCAKRFKQNNPANLVDPSGRFPILAILIGAAIGGAINASIALIGGKGVGAALWAFVEGFAIATAVGAGAVALGAGLSIIGVPKAAATWGAVALAGAYGGVSNYQKYGTVWSAVAGALSWGLTAYYGVKGGWEWADAMKMQSVWRKLSETFDRVVSVTLEPQFPEFPIYENWDTPCGPGSCLPGDRRGCIPH